MTQPLLHATSDSTQLRSASRFAHIMPLAFITYGLAYLDRVNYASAEKGLSASLGFSERTGIAISQSFSLFGHRHEIHWVIGMGPVVSASFFLGYCLFQIPGAIYASHRSVKWLVFWALVLWGCLSGLTGVIRSVPLLITDRILLGAVEGVVLPSMLIFLNRWFTKRERSRSNSLLMLTNPVTMATASIICGIIIQFFDAHRIGPYAGWQMMFIVEGLPSIIWAFFWMKLADERPAEASWLAKEDAQRFQAVLDQEQQGIKGVHNYRAAFSDPRVIKLSGMFMCFSSASYGLMMWLPGIVAEGAKQRPAMAGFLTSLPYLIAIFTMLVVSWLSDKSLRRKRFVVASMFAGGLAFCVAYIAGPQHFLISFIGLIVVGSCIYTPTAPLWAWMAEMLPRNVAGESMALVNSFGALGGFFGTLIVGLLKDHFHSNGAAFIFQACCFAGAGLLGLSARSTARPTQEPIAELDVAHAPPGEMP